MTLGLLYYDYKHKTIGPCYLEQHKPLYFIDKDSLLQGHTTLCGLCLYMI